MVRSHWLGDSFADAAAAPVYLTSVNALAETGELINIDGTGNRVASTIFGHEEVYFIVGVNKLAPDYDAALWRARNVASPKRPAAGQKTPLRRPGDKCYDCKARSASAAPWWCCGRGPPASAGPRWCWSTSLWATEEREGVALKRGMAAALALSCALLLTGCSSLLENPYAVVEPHTERPATAEDSSAVQAGTYSELVNTVLFLSPRGQKRG